MTEPIESASDDVLLPMREVASLTGVNPITLRAWERRHGLIRPVRTVEGIACIRNRTSNISVASCSGPAVACRSAR